MAGRLRDVKPADLKLPTTLLTAQQTEKDNSAEMPSATYESHNAGATTTFEVRAHKDDYLKAKDALRTKASGKLENLDGGFLCASHNDGLTAIANCIGGLKGGYYTVDINAKYDDGKQFPYDVMRNNASGFQDDLVKANREKPKK